MLRPALSPILSAALLVFGASTLSAQSLVSAPSFMLGNAPYPPTSANFAPAQGDFNRDGKLDFIVADVGNQGNGIDLVLGNGDGTFQKPLPVGTASGFISDVAVADFNKDGNLDIVTFDTSSHFSVFYGNGNGTFQAPVVFSTPAYPTSGTVGNFYNDGYTDIAFTDGNGDIEVYRNEGGRNFVLISTVQAGAVGGFSLVRAGEINGSGADDLGALSQTGAYVLWNNGQGAFTKVLLSTYAYAEDLSIANVNQDGRADIVVSYSCQSSTGGGVSTCGGIDVYYGQGANKTFFRHAVTDATASSVYSVKAVDVNGDGIADLVAAVNNSTNSADGMYVWLGNPDGSFNQTPNIFNIGYAGRLIAGDFNGDGAMDFVTYGEIFINGGQIGPLQTSQISPTVLVQAVDNTYLGTPLPEFPVRATAYDKNKITAMQVYVDGQLEYSQDVTSVNYTTYPLSGGQHLIVTKAWDATGVSFISPRTVTVYSGDPGRTCPAPMGGATMCLPTGTLQASGPVLVLANGNTPNVPTAAQLYIDGKLVVNNRGFCNTSTNCSGGVSFVQTSQTLAAGNHNLYFKLWDSQGNTYTAEKNITVQ